MFFMFMTTSRALGLKCPCHGSFIFQTSVHEFPPFKKLFLNGKTNLRILALLRQCNYDLDEVTNIYLSLLTEDVMGKNKKPGSKRQKGRSGSSQEHTAEVELLKERIEKLEEQLREKESQLEESKAANEDLKARLKSSEETARKLQTKGECLQLEIEELKSAPEPEPVLPVIEVVQPVIEKVQPTIEVVLPVSQPIPQVQPVIPTPPPPKAPTISKETCRNIKSTVRLFFSDVGGVEELLLRRNGRDCLDYGSSAKLFA